MTQLDFLGHCAPSSDTGNSVVERIRARSAEVMLAVYRLVKTSLVHSLDNAALRDTAARCASTLHSLAAEIGAPVSLSFVGDTIFVCGQLLRAPRSVYEAAAEMGKLLEGIGVSELTFEPGPDEARMLHFASEVATAVRESENRQVVLELNTAGVEARSIDPQLLQRRSGEQPAEQILRLYATALVLLRQFYEDLASGATVLPQKVKRLAQRFVVLAEREDPAMLGMTTMAKAHRDDAGRAVQTANLALAMARQITKDRVALSQLVLSALLLDSGRARAKGRAGNRHLSDKEEAFVVPAAAFTCLSTGGVNPANARRAALVTETAWLERVNLLGPVWGGELGPFFASGILALARDFLERVAPRDGSKPMPHLDAVDAVISRSGTDRVLGRLLVRALGVVPVGTVVALTSGAWAVVIGPSKVGAHASLVRTVIDEKGNEVSGGAPIDLGTNTSIAMKTIVDSEAAQFSTTGAFL